MGEPSRVYIIAEAGVNHNGSLKMAMELIDAAKSAGADAVKFQTFIAEKAVSRYAPKAEYQNEGTDRTETQLEMVQKLKLDKSMHEKLIKHCNHRDIQFLSTPFDLESINLLAATFNLPCLKIASGEITNGPLLLKAASTGKPIILSTGMSTLGEIEMALSILAFGYTQPDQAPSLQAFKQAFYSQDGQASLTKNITLLHCTTEYPAPFEDVNLRAMDVIKEAFNLPVGFSDHTYGFAVPIAAVARGAIIIEKHFTLDRNLPGPDHKASLEPDELKTMITSIRQVEAALGSPIKVPAKSELKNLSIARKSLVAARSIQAGEIFSKDNLTSKRPGDGISPIFYWDWLGKVAKKDYEEDEVIG